MSLILLFFVVILPLILYGFLRTKNVQTYLAGKVTTYLSKELKTDIHITGIDVSWFLDVVLEGVYVGGQDHDTLLFAPKIILDVDKLHYRRHDLNINSITLDRAFFSLNRKMTDSTYNIQYLLHYFASSDTTTNPNRKPWKVYVKGVSLRDSRFRLNDAHQPDTLKGVNVAHLDLNHINLILKDITINNDTITTRIEQVALIDKSGFRIVKMNAAVFFSSKQITLKDFNLRTTYSNIETDLSFRFDELADFNDFVDKVDIKAYLLPSDVDMKDLVYFVPEMKGMEEHLIIDGEVEGKINNLKMKDFRFEYGTFTRFRGNIRLKGLPDIEETFIQLVIKEFNTTHYDLNNISLPGGAKLSVPEQIVQMGNIRVKGNFTGFFNDFVSYAQFNSEIGSVFTDLSLKSNAKEGNIEYSGNVKAKEFNIGQLLGQKDLGKCNLEATLTGSGLSLDNLILNIDGIIDSIYFKNNNFREVRISGGFINRTFSGNLMVRDNRLEMDFDGSVNLNKIHPVFDFTALIKNASLNSLNLTHSDSVMSIATNLTAHVEGIDPDSITGSLRLDSTTFRMNRSRYFMNRMDFSVTPVENGAKNILLNSDFVDASLNGSFTWEEILPSFKNMIAGYLPALFRNQNLEPVKNNPRFVFKALLKNTDPFSRMFLPIVKLAPRSELHGTYNPSENITAFHADAGWIDVSGVHLSGWSMDASFSAGKMGIKTACEHLDLSDSLGLDRLVLESKAGNDTVSFSVNWQNENQKVKNSGDLKGYLSLIQHDIYRFHFNPSKTIVNDSLWIIPDNNLVTIDSTSIRIDNLLFVSGSEKIKLDGEISPDPQKPMDISLDGFDLSNFDILTLDQDVDFDGLISGKIEVRNLMKIPIISTNLTVHGLAFNKDKLGNAVISTNWIPDMKAVYARVDIIYRGNIGESKPLQLDGYYYPDKRDNNLDFNIKISDFKLRTISNFLSAFTSKFTGYATGDLTLKGSFAKPVLTGKVNVKRGLIRIDYLNTEYSFSNEVEFGRNFIGLNELVAYDSLGNKATIEGKIYHDYFYRFRVDITVKPNNTLVLNTERADNDLFYGRGFASGNVHIHGPVDNIVIDITAKTCKGTQVYLPINTTMDVSENAFITFTNARTDTVHRLHQQLVDDTGIGVNFDLNVTPDASIKIFMPFDMGNIKTTGSGKLKLLLNTRGQFNIYGDYRVKDGSFLFTLQNVINRYFEIQQGGTIMFSGDPYDTQLDLRAQYVIDVPLTGLRLSADQLQNLKKKIPIRCIIDLKGNLFNPELTFKIATSEKDPPRSIPITSSK
ncbi:MAG: translocation/assembly module TamB domain-containing protein [Bacteroidetes bacterium]|nr:translocation/assembly module TamB domain-containing protein [Bacteroidota bacterium]